MKMISVCLTIYRLNSKALNSYALISINLPDTTASIIFRKRMTETLGFFTDILWRGRHRMEYLLKFSLGMMINPDNF